MNAWHRRHLVVTVAVLLVCAALVVTAILQLALADRVAGGVTCGDVDLSGMSAQEATETLQRNLWPRISAVRLHLFEDDPLTMSLERLGMSFDATATAQAALMRGRRQLPLGLSVWLPGSGGEVAPRLIVDGERYELGLKKLRRLVDQRPRDARLKLREGWGIVVVPSRVGRTVDATELARLIGAAAAAGTSYDGPVPIRTVEPNVDTALAQSRASVAATYFARPIRLRHGSRSVILTPSMIARMVKVNTGVDAGDYPLTFRNNRARRALHRLFAWAERPPSDARIVVGADGGITIKESRDGEALDMRCLLQDLDAAAANSGLRSVVVSTSPVLPALTTEEVRDNGLASVGSQFTTFFDRRNAARARNIALAAKLVDGSAVRPGEVFSLNAAVGPRTTNRGFDFAPVIAGDGVLRQGVGGGICQYATTLFNAVLFAGLPVVDRREHALYIDHYPIGRDATVAWGSIDFRFRNDTPKTLVIRSWVQGGSLTVAIVGKTGRTVNLKTGEFYNLRKPKHGADDPRVVYDDDLGPGVVRWEKGVDGRSVKVERTVRSADGTVLFRDSFVSHYQPLDWVKRVGTS